MFYIKESNGSEKKFEYIDEVKDYVRTGFDRFGGYEWIDEIYDDEGNEYGCEWSLKIVKTE